MAGGPLLLGGRAFADGTTSTTFDELSLTETVGPAVFGAPITVTMKVTAPAGHSAHGVVLTTVLPAGATYLPGSITPSTLAATVLPPTSTDPPGSSTLVVSGVGDLAAGQAATVTFQVSTPAPLGTVLDFGGTAAASARADRPVPVDRHGRPLPARIPSWEELCRADGAATIGAYGVTVTDPGTPVMSNALATTGAVPTTVTVTEAGGFDPSTVTVDAYLPSGTTIAPAGGTTGAATPFIAALNPADPTVPALPVAAPPPPLSPGQPLTPSAPFTRMEWTIPSVDSTHPAVLSLNLDVPKGGAHILFVASGSVSPTVAAALPAAPVIPALPPAPAPVAIPSAGSAIEVVAAAPAPITPPAPAPIPLPTPPSRPALPPGSSVRSAHLVPTRSITKLTSQPVRPHLVATFAPLAPVTMMPRLAIETRHRPILPAAPPLAEGAATAKAATGARPSPWAAGRNPFASGGGTAPPTRSGSTPTPSTPTPTPTTHTGTSLPTTGQAASPSTPLAYTGAAEEEEFILAALLLISGAAMAAGSLSGYRSYSPRTALPAASAPPA